MTKFDLEKEKEKFDWNDYLINKSIRNNRKARQYFKSIGEIPEYSSELYVLHHIDPTMKYFDLSRYTDWRIEDLMVLTDSEHQKLHKDFERRNAEYGFLDKLMEERMNFHCFSEKVN